MKRLFIILWAVFSLPILVAAQTGEVVQTEAKGTGLKREDALQDALRNAIGQAVGVAMQSETKVENYLVISDAISSNVKGYIKSYEVLGETPFPDRYELKVKAAVTTSSMKADFGLLARGIGGVRFMVVYDPRSLDEGKIAHFNHAVDRMNEYLSSKGYRYIERKRFESLRQEASRILEADKSEISYVQQLGLLSDAQFIIHLENLTTESRSEQFDTRTSSKVTMQVKAYDNCTAEGLGMMVFESGRNSSSDPVQVLREGITEAINKNADLLIGRFASYIGNWINNGTPYELRFYNTGTYRDFRDLRAKMKELSQFGGEMEIVSADNYTKLNCTFKKKPDELADKVLDIADQIPGFKEKVMDVKLIYGRQINFAPRNAVVPQLQSVPGASAGMSADKQESAPAATVSGSAEAVRQNPVPVTSAGKPSVSGNASSSKGKSKPVIKKKNR
jgi:hypothetical protein